VLCLYTRRRSINIAIGRSHQGSKQVTDVSDAINCAFKSSRRISPTLISQHSCIFCASSLPLSATEKLNSRRTFESPGIKRWKTYRKSKIIIKENYQSRRSVLDLVATFKLGKTPLRLITFPSALPPSSLVSL
jgi:hypothetical protein